MFNLVKNSILLWRIYSLNKHTAITREWTTIIKYCVLQNNKLMQNLTNSSSWYVRCDLKTDALRRTAQQKYNRCIFCSLLVHLAYVIESYRAIKLLFSYLDPPPPDQCYSWSKEHGDNVMISTHSSVCYSRLRTCSIKQAHKNRWDLVTLHREIVFDVDESSVFTAIVTRVTTHLENLEKSGNSKVVREKSGKMEKSQGKWNRVWFFML